MGRAPGAKGSARHHTADLGAVINPCGCFGLDMGGKPGSISVQMAPGDATVGSRPTTEVHNKALAAYLSEQSSAESISNRGLRGLLLNFRLLFGSHSRIPANEGLPELIIEDFRPHLEQIVRAYHPILR